MSTEQPRQRASGAGGAAAAPPHSSSSTSASPSASTSASANDGSAPSARPRNSILSSYYAIGAEKREREKTFDVYSLDSAHFDSDKYINKLFRERHFNELVEHDNSLNREIRTLDSKLQTLVYQNYNKFISATDTIRSMKDHVANMGGEMDRLSSTLQEINTCSDQISTKLAPGRQKIEQLSSVSRTLKKLQFLLELPSRLNQCIELQAYSQAVKYYNIAASILIQYQHINSFQSIQRESIEVMNRLRKILRSRIADPQQLPDRQVQEAVSLLLSLNEPKEQLCEEFLSAWSKFLLDTLSSSWKLDQETLSATQNLKSLNAVLLPKIGNLVRLFNSVFLATPTSSQSSSKLQQQEKMFYLRKFVDWSQKVFTEYFARIKSILLIPLQQKNKPSQSNSNSDALHQENPNPDFVPTLNVYLENDKPYRIDDDNDDSIQHKFGAEGMGITSGNSDPDVNNDSDEDFRNALLLFSNDLISIHKSIPEANLNDQIIAILQACLKSFIDSIFRQVQERIETRLDRLITAQLQTSELLQETAGNQNSKSQLYRDCVSVARSLLRDFDRMSIRIQLIISSPDALLVSHTSLFMQMVNAGTLHLADCILAKINSVCTPKAQSVREKESVQSTPLGFILLSRFCLSMSTHLVGDIDTMLKKRFKGDGTIFNAANLVKKFEQSAQNLLVRFVESQGKTVSLLVKKDILGPTTWLDRPVPVGVGQMAIALVREVRTVDILVQSLYPDERGRSNSMSSDNSSTHRSSSYRDSSRSMRDVGKREVFKRRGDPLNLNLAIAKDMERVFSKRLSTFSIRPPQFNRTSIITNIVMIGLKTLLECVRLRTFNLNAFHQLQVDSQHLRGVWRELVEDENYLGNLIDEISASTAARCIESPKTLEPLVLETLCNNHSDQPNTVDTAATTPSMPSQS